MRVKSYLEGAAPRGRTSKIQNHVVHVHVGRAAIEFFTELQPLFKKDARTIAYSLISTAAQAFAAICSGVAAMKSECDRARVIHIIVGDGVNTNDSACRRVLKHFTAWAADHCIRYALVVIQCASHKANLVVQVAICGQILGRALENDALTGTCSRLFNT